MRRWRWAISISRKNAWRASRSFVNAAAPSCFARTARITSAACATAPCGWPHAASPLLAPPARARCARAVWRAAGSVRALGATEPVLGAYEMHSRLRSAPAAPVGTSAPQGLSPAPDGGGARILSLTPAALGPGEAALRATAALVATTRGRGGGGGKMWGVRVADGGRGEPAVLEHADLVATSVVRGRGDEQPNIGFMIEQSRGSGITSLATHEEGAAPVRQADGSWRSVLTFPALPLHSGEYVVSAFLFDASGLVVYDQWLQHLHF